MWITITSPSSFCRISSFGSLMYFTPAHKPNLPQSLPALLLLLLPPLLCFPSFCSSASHYFLSALESHFSADLFFFFSSLLLFSPSSGLTRLAQSLHHQCNGWRAFLLSSPLSSLSPSHCLLSSFALFFRVGKVSLSMPSPVWWTKSTSWLLCGKGLMDDVCLNAIMMWWIIRYKRKAEEKGKEERRKEGKEVEREEEKVDHEVQEREGKEKWRGRYRCFIVCCSFFLFSPAQWIFSQVTPTKTERWRKEGRKKERKEGRKERRKEKQQPKENEARRRRMRKEKLGYTERSSI